MIWFISDEHYGHCNIIRYTGRPFASVGEMDRTILSTCTKVFQPTDLVWHLGDFCWNPKKRIAKTLAAMPGTHCIVRGSHDRGAETLRALGFAVAVESAVVNLEGRRIILRHKPLYDPLPEGISGVFHGHIHQGFPEDLVAAGERSDVPPWNVNLSVEKTGYGPISYKAALRQLAEQQ